MFHKLKIICKRKSFSLKFPSFGSIVESLSSEEDKLVSKEGGETSDVRHQSEAAAAANLLFCSVGDEERRGKNSLQTSFLSSPPFSSRLLVTHEIGPSAGVVAAIMMEISDERCCYSGGDGGMLLRCEIARLRPRGKGGGGREPLNLEPFSSFLHNEEWRH